MFSPGKKDKGIQGGGLTASEICDGEALWPVHKTMGRILLLPKKDVLQGLIPKKKKNDKAHQNTQPERLAFVRRN